MSSQVLKSRLNPRDAEFQENARHHRALAQELKEKLAWAGGGGGEKARRRHEERGKLLVRDRIGLLLDEGSPFLELSPLAAIDQYGNDAPSAGIVSGMGRVKGRMVMVVANDATVKGGTYYPVTVKKHLRAQDIALENNLPCVYLVDSGGAFLPMQAEVFPDRDHFGRIFFNQARLSARGLTQVAVVMGSCTAGGAYVPAMSDETIIVANQGTIFLGGPPRGKAATGADGPAEELGGGAVHARLSGVADHLASDDRDALGRARAIIGHLPLDPPRPARLDFRTPTPPLYDPEELYGVLPANPRKPVEAREVLARLLDASVFDEFKKEYAPSLLTGFGHLMGMPVGVLINNGVLFSESALKGAHFIELCEQRGCPILFLQNITGFMVGKEYEHRGIAKDGAKMVTAVATATVPKITLLFGGSFGAGNYGMCGRAYAPRFLFTWPNARISVMGGEQAAGVLAQVKREQLAAAGKTLSPEEEEKITRPVREQFEREGLPWYATSRLWDDGVIAPTDTRQVLALALETALREPGGMGRFGLFRM